jgi:multidrug efflux pump subunit AcrA (membrane-fusion protein)
MTNEHTQSTGNDPLDLAALGQTWNPPNEVDTAPEVADVIGEAPWWAARGLLYIILGFLAVALIWAYFGKIDIVVESRGALVPEGAVRPVQAVGGGMVQYVFVREGDRVERGQPLIQVEATESRTRLVKLREELIASREQLRQLRAAKGPIAETLEQENRISRLQSEITAAEFGLKQTTILAPVSGVITTLTSRGAGIVLQPGQQVATIAPSGARLVVEAQLANKDIAFVEKGLRAKIKLDAFPFQDYGILGGRIIDVSPDAVSGKESESFYKVTIALDQTSVVARGKSIPLRPGLTLMAEIVTERKSILNLFLEPFQQLKSKAGGA